jgi:tetratricopeptide (TPR) repeat protein
MGLSAAQYTQRCHKEALEFGLSNNQITGFFFLCGACSNSNYPKGSKKAPQVKNPEYIIRQIAAAVQWSILPPSDKVLESDLALPKRYGQMVIHDRTKAGEPREEADLGEHSSVMESLIAAIGSELAMHGAITPEKAFAMGIGFSKPNLLSSIDNTLPKDLRWLCSLADDGTPYCLGILNQMMTPQFRWLQAWAEMAQLESADPHKSPGRLAGVAQAFWIGSELSKTDESRRLSTMTICRAIEQLGLANLQITEFIRVVSSIRHCSLPNEGNFSSMIVPTCQTRTEVEECIIDYMRSRRWLTSPISSAPPAQDLLLKAAIVNACVDLSMLNKEWNKCLVEEDMTRACFDITLRASSLYMQYGQLGPAYYGLEEFIKENREIIPSLLQCDIFNRQGMILRHAGNFEAAIAHYRKALTAIASTILAEIESIDNRNALKWQSTPGPIWYHMANSALFELVVSKGKEIGKQAAVGGLSENGVAAMEKEPDIFWDAEITAQDILAVYPRPRYYYGFLKLLLQDPQKAQNTTLILYNIAKIYMLQANKEGAAAVLREAMFFYPNSDLFTNPGTDMAQAIEEACNHSDMQAKPYPLGSQPTW